MRKQQTCDEQKVKVVNSQVRQLQKGEMRSTNFWRLSCMFAHTKGVSFSERGGGSLLWDVPTSDISGQQFKLNPTPHVFSLIPQQSSLNSHYAIPTHVRYTYDHVMCSYVCRNAAESFWRSKQAPHVTVLKPPLSQNSNSRVTMRKNISPKLSISRKNKERFQ